DRALDDLSRAYSIQERNDIRFLRMQAAYYTRDRANYRLALQDAEALATAFANDPVRQAEARLIQARILVDRSDADDTADLEQAVTILIGLRGMALTTIQRGMVEEYIARTYYLLGRPNEALGAVTAAINQQPTANRHYLRGLIHEALGEPDLARRDYEWVLVLTGVYPQTNSGFSLDSDERERLEAFVEGETS